MGRLERYDDGLEERPTVCSSCHELEVTIPAMGPNLAQYPATSSNRFAPSCEYAKYYMGLHKAPFFLFAEAYQLLI